MKKIFHRYNTALFKISKQKLVIGILLGIFNAILFYVFLFLFREIIIVLSSLSHDYEVLILSKDKQNFYNLFYAFIAVFYGYSVVFNYWFEIPNGFLIKYLYKRKTILNQQRFTNWFFLSWMSRMALFFGTFTVDYYRFNFYPTYNYIVFLIVIVLFGQIWISIRSLFNKNYFKWFIITLITTGILTFSISKIDIIDIDTLHSKILQKNVLYKNNLRIVESKIFTKLEHRSLVFEIFIALKDNKPIILVNGKEISDTELHAAIKLFHTRNMSEAEIPFVNYVLNIDKEVKASFILSFKEKLKKIGVNKVSYSVKPITDEKISFYINTNYIFIHYLHNNHYRKTNEIHLYILENGTYFFNSKKVSLSNLKNEIYTFYKNKKPTPVRVYVNSTTSFDRYFATISSLKEGIDSLRNEYALKTYHKKLDELNRKAKRTVKQKIYWIVSDGFKESKKSNNIKPL